MWKGTQDRIITNEFHRGIDGVNAVVNTPDGFCLEAENVDLSTPGRVGKRAGYVQHACPLPIRTRKLVVTADSATVTLDYIPLQSVTMQLYLNTGANSAYYPSSDFRQVDDRYGTVFAVLSSSSVTLTVDTIIEVLGSDGAFHPICPCVVFDNTHCLLPIAVLAWFTPTPTLTDTSGYAANGRLCQGFSLPALREADVSAVTKVENQKVKLTMNPDLLNIGSIVLFETCLRPNVNLLPQISGIVVSKDNESITVLTENFLGFSDAIANHYLVIRYLNGNKYWLKTEAYSIISKGPLYASGDYKVKITGSCELRMKGYVVPDNESFALPAIGTYNISGFLYGTDASAGYVQTLSKYFDSATNLEKLVSCYDGNLFAEVTNPNVTADTISGLVNAGATTTYTYTPSTNTFDIPLTNAHLVYKEGDTVLIRYANTTANNDFTEDEYTVYGTATNVLKLNAVGKKSLTLLSKQKIRFSRTSNEVYLNTAEEFLFAGMTVQIGASNKQNPVYKIKIVDVDSEDVTIGHNKVTLDTEVTWSSDSYISLQSVFYPVFQKNSNSNMQPAYLNKSIVDINAVPMERSVFLTCGKNGIFRYNGDKLLSMNIPRCPGGLIRNIRGSGGFLQTDEDTDTTRLGRTYEFIVTYSYGELANGVLREYESGLTPTGVLDIISVQALDGSTNSQLVELQIPCIPNGIGLPADSIKINVYRTPSGKVSTQPTAEPWLLERQIDNNPSVPFITIVAGTEPPFLFTESNYKTLYSSISLDTAKDENAREIIAPPLANICASFDTRLFAAAGYEQPYVNIICNNVFNTNGVFSSPFTLTYTDADFTVKKFVSCRLSPTTTSETDGGAAGDIKFQSVGVDAYEIKKITCQDDSNLFKITGYAVTDGTKYLLRFAAGTRENTTLGGQGYYDNFGFASQTFTGTATANTVSAQKKWKTKTSAGAVVTPSEKFLVFKFLKAITSIGPANGVLISGGSQAETKNSPEIYLMITEAGASVSVNDRLILLGLGTTGLLKSATGALLNWDRDIVARVSSVTNAGGVTEAKLVVSLIGASSAGATVIDAVQGLTADLFVSNVSTGVSCSPFNIFKLEGSQTAPYNDYAVSNFALSPTTATIQLTTSPSISVSAGDRICVDNLPAGIPSSTLGMNYNQTFEITNFVTDTFTVKVKIPDDVLGNVGKDFTSDTVKGKLVVPKNMYATGSGYIEIPLTSTLLTVSAAINTWVFMVSRGKEFDNWNAQFSGYFKIVKLKNATTWVDSLAIGDTITGVRIEWLGSSPDYSALTGASTSRVVFCDGSTAATNIIAVPVPASKDIDDLCGDMFGPTDGFTPLEKLIKRLGLAINTVLREKCFAYWGGSKLGNVVGVLPTNGIKIIPHLWPENQYQHAYDTATIPTLNREPTWGLKGATGVFTIRGDSEYVSDGNENTVKTAKEYYPSRFWYTNPFDTLKAATRAFRQMSYDDIDSSDGEEIVALVPFQNFLVAFKRNSIWRIRFGENPVPIKEKIPCVVGASGAKNLAVTERGIFFLHSTGLYITDGTMVEPILQPNKYFLQRVVQNQNLFPFCAGHHNPLTKTAYIGVPLSDDEYSLAADVRGQFVFNYSLKQVSLDSINSGWSVNTQIPATNWIRLYSDDYFSDLTGKVFRFRTETGATKYQDDESGIPFKLSTAYIHGGDEAEYKSIRYAMYQFGKDTSADIDVSYATNYADDYQLMDTVNVTKETWGSSPWGKGYYGSDRIVDIVRQTPTTPRVNSISFKFENAIAQQNVELLGLFLQAIATGSKMLRENKAAQ